MKNLADTRGEILPGAHDAAALPNSTLFTYP
jgi:hypothetical protein